MAMPVDVTMSAAFVAADTLGSPLAGSRGMMSVGSMRAIRGAIATCGAENNIRVSTTDGREQFSISARLEDAPSMPRSGEGDSSSSVDQQSSEPFDIRR